MKKKLDRFSRELVEFFKNWTNPTKKIYKFFDETRQILQEQMGKSLRKNGQILKEKWTNPQKNNCTSPLKKLDEFFKKNWSFFQVD